MFPVCMTKRVVADARFATMADAVSGVSGCGTSHVPGYMLAHTAYADHAICRVSDDEENCTRVALTRGRQAAEVKQTTISEEVKS